MREEEVGVKREKHYSSESQQCGHLKTGLILLIISDFSFSRIRLIWEREELGPFSTHEDSRYIPTVGPV